MGTVTDIKDKTSEDFDGFEQKTIEVRGKSYTFRELSSGEYDDAVSKSRDKSNDNLPDSVQLLRWMIIKGSIEPKLDAAALAKLPLGVVGKISDAVNEIHFGPNDFTSIAERMREVGWTVEAPAEDSEGPKDGS